MMAGCTNGMAEMAKPTEIMDIDLEKATLGRDLAERACRVDEGDEPDVDVDKTAVLGRELAEMVCGVDEGAETEHNGESQLQQTNLLYREIGQHNGNTMDDIPSARKLPLVGEWTVCASSKVSNLEVKPVGSSNKLETLVIVSIELEGPDGSGIPCVCLGGTQCRINKRGGVICSTLKGGSWLFWS